MSSMGGHALLLVTCLLGGDEVFESRPVGVEVSSKRLGSVAIDGIVRLLEPTPSAWIAAPTASGAKSGVAVSARGSSHSTWRDKVYRPANTLDRDYTTAWVEGVRGAGVGEWVELTAEARSDEALALIGLVILPGFAKNSFMFGRNGRPKHLRVTVTPGAGDPERPDVRLVLEDARRPQVFYLDAPRRFDATRRLVVRLTVEAVYAGSHYADTSIAEVRLLFSRDAS